MSEVVEKNTFKKRFKSMIKVDFKRLFHSPSYYIMLGISFIIPILVLVMTTLMDGNVSINPETGEETVFEGFKSVWQIIGTVSGSDEASMDITSMCNINLMFFIVLAFVVIFIGEEFRSGYVKNLFTVRSKKNDYIISKEIVLFIVGVNM
ncbi:MAG: ABC transporter permease, partial [Anaeroplasmataceae bacterium]